MSDPMDVDFSDAPAPPRRAARAERISVQEAGEAIRQGSAQAALMGGDRINGTARTMPHSDEAEEYLLACCLIDPVDIPARSRAAGITPDTFYASACGNAFRVICDMVDAGKIVDQATFAEEFKSRGMLDAENGYTFITRITSDKATTAQASQWIERVRKTAILRQIIRGSLERAEAAFSVNGDMDAFLDDYRREAIRVCEWGAAGAASEVMERAFDLTRLVPRPDPVYSISDIPVCTRGNLTTIYSQAKTGKSSFIGAMVSATMTTPTSGHDTLGVTGPNYQKHAVLHFDTEQSPYDWQQLVQLTLRRAGLVQPPSWLMSFTIAGMEAAKAERFIQQAIRLAKKTHGGIHSVFIDGVADLVNDPNSPDECFPLVARLHGMAIEFDTAIVNILHLNPTAKEKQDKGRGHLGSQLERKCESNLTLKKEGDVTVVTAEGRQRGRPIPADKAPAFRWSDDDRMHRTTSVPAADEPSEKSNRGRKVNYTFAEYRPIFPAHSEPPKKMKELFRAATAIVPIKSESQFYNVLQRFVQEGGIEAVDVAGGRGYRLAV